MTNQSSGAQRQVPRSRLFAEALQEYVSRHGAEAITAKLNEISDSGLPRPSVVNVSQVLTLDRTLLTAQIKALPGKTMARVDEGLLLVLGL